jgi:hypothetical protein
MRIRKNPYYFGRQGDDLVVLVAGGTKEQAAGHCE